MVCWHMGKTRGSIRTVVPARFIDFLNLRWDSVRIVRSGMKEGSPLPAHVDVEGCCRGVERVRERVRERATKNEDKGKPKRVNRVKVVKGPKRPLT
jgi:hypothetical protein